MGKLEILKVHDPKKPGDYLWINASDFEASKHQLFSEPISAPEPIAEPAPEATTRRPARQKRGGNRVGR